MRDSLLRAQICGKRRAEGEEAERECVCGWRGLAWRLGRRGEEGEQSLQNFRSWVSLPSSGQVNPGGPQGEEVASAWDSPLSGPPVCSYWSLVRWACSPVRERWPSVCSSPEPPWLDCTDCSGDSGKDLACKPPLYK